MKNLLLLCFCFCWVSLINAQELSVDQQNNFSIGENHIDQQELKKLLKEHPLVLKTYQKGRLQYVTGGILLLSGGGLLGYEIGRVTNGNDPNWQVVGIEAGIVALGLLVSKGYKKKYKKAVDLYNTSKKQNKPSLKPSKKGIGLLLQF